MYGFEGEFLLDLIETKTNTTRKKTRFEKKMPTFQFQMLFEWVNEWDWLGSDSFRFDVEQC